MATENLQIPDVLANQNQKEVTSNTANNLLDRAMNGRVSKTITVSTSFTTTETRENHLIELTGTPGSPFTVDMPDTNRRTLSVLNNTDAQATIRNSAGGGSGQPVLAVGDVALFHYNGTNFVDLVGAFSFLSLTDTPSSYSGQGGKVVAVNGGETALEFVTGGAGGGGGGGGQGSLSYRGAAVKLDGSQSIPNNTFTPVQWDSAFRQTKHDNLKFWLGVNATFTANASTDEVTVTSHGMETGDGPFRFTTTGTLPAGLSLATNYWAIKTGTDTFRVATTFANAQSGIFIDITDTGSGTHTLDRETRLVVPEGVTSVRLIGQTFWASNTTGLRALQFVKNGSSADLSGLGFFWDDPDNGTPGYNAASAIVSVIGGDFFDLQVIQVSGSPLNLVNTDNRTWASIEAMEYTVGSGARTVLTTDETIASGTSPVIIPWDAADYNDKVGTDAIPFWLGPNFTFTTVDTSEDTATITAHGKFTGQGPYTLTTSGTLPAGLATGTNYWLIKVTDNLVRFSTSISNALAGTFVDITDAGSGTHTLNGSTRFGIPTGVPFADISFNGALTAGGTANTRRRFSVAQYDSADTLLYQDRSEFASGDTESGSSVNNLRIPTSSGDYFEVDVLQVSTASLDLDATFTSFSIRVSS